MRALAALLAAGLVACGGGPMAPEPCSELEDVTLYAGEQGRVLLCYVGDDYPAIEVESSDPEIVDVTFRVDTRVVGLFAHSPGEVTVTVTAYGADDAVGEETFRVIVPNRAPEIAGVLDPAPMVPGARWRWDLDGLFEDPDGQEVRYSATSSDAAVATATVADAINRQGEETPHLTVEARAVGVAEVTVTASDGELSAPATFELEVAPVGVAYEETFADGLNGWATLNITGGADSRARVRNGAIEVWSDGATPVPGGAYIEREIPYFDLRARLQPAPRNSGTLASLALLLDSEVYSQVEVMLEAGAFVVWAWNNAVGGAEEWTRGQFDIDANSFTDVRWWYAASDGRYRVEFSNGRDTRQITIPPEHSHPEIGFDASPTITTIALFAHHLGDRSGEANLVRLDEITIRGGVLDARRAAATAPTWRRIR